MYTHSAQHFEEGKIQVTEKQKVLILLDALILVYIVFKTTFFFKVQSKLGLMSALLLGVIVQVIPFLFIFLFFVLFFSILSAILGSNYNLAMSYPGLTLPFGYYFQTFENGLGNISSPSVNFLKDDFT